MQYAMIGTWEMAWEGLEQARPLIASGAPVADAIEQAVCAVENNPENETVGFGGLPDQNGEVALDAAYMHGDSLLFGAVLNVRNVQNPIQVARKLSVLRKNCVLSGYGAEIYALKHGFAFRNMLTDAAREKWAAQKAAHPDSDALFIPSTHDTVCVVGRDLGGHMGVGVSTSGLFMKHPGRIGDSPIIGSGFYCDSLVGGAAATGLGEDIMKGCLSYEIVRMMKQGLSPQSACEQAVVEHQTTLARRGYSREDFAVIALSAQGEIGAASNMACFPFAALTVEGAALKMRAVLKEGKTVVEPMNP